MPIVVLAISGHAERQKSLNMLTERRLKEGSKMPVLGIQTRCRTIEHPTFLQLLLPLYPLTLEKIAHGGKLFSPLTIKQKKQTIHFPSQ